MRPEGAEPAVELAAAVDRADDRVDVDRLQAELTLAPPSERLDHLLERQDHVDVAGFGRAGGWRAERRARRRRARLKSN